MRNVPIFLATVGGVGRIPWAPGTWGSAVGVCMGVLLARTTRWSVLLGILAAAFCVCALVCQAAARALREPDPRAVILDEVWGMAAVIMVIPWIAFSPTWLLTAFGLFRLFDIAKPPPLKRLARLAGGWGIMADDLGAAIYAIVVIYAIATLLGPSSWFLVP